MGRGTKDGGAVTIGPVFAGGLLVGRIMMRSNTDAFASGVGRSAAM
jgi:hypothetical protein